MASRYRTLPNGKRIDTRTGRFAKAIKRAGVTSAPTGNAQTTDDYIKQLYSSKKLAQAYLQRAYDGDLQAMQVVTNAVSGLSASSPYDLHRLSFEKKKLLKSLLDEARADAPAPIPVPKAVPIEDEPMEPEPEREANTAHVQNLSAIAPAPAPKPNPQKEELPTQPPAPEPGKEPPKPPTSRLRPAWLPSDEVLSRAQPSCGHRQARKMGFDSNDPDYDDGYRGDDDDFDLPPPEPQRRTN